MNELGKNCKFRVVRNVAYRLDEQRDETIYSYEIEFQKTGIKEFIVEISNFTYSDYAKKKMLDHSIDKLFNEYNAAFFPVLLHFKDDICFLKNKENIIQRLKTKIIN
nr:hypothetical protein [uncultured Flavobacterium sp.]